MQGFMTFVKGSEGGEEEEVKLLNTPAGLSERKQGMNEQPHKQAMVVCVREVCWEDEVRRLQKKALTSGDIAKDRRLFCLLRSKWEKGKKVVDKTFCHH